MHTYIQYICTMKTILITRSSGWGWLENRRSISCGFENFDPTCKSLAIRTHCVWLLVMSHAAGTSSVGHVPKKKRLVEPKSLGYSIGVIGSGNIARALVEGILASGKDSVT